MASRREYEMLFKLNAQMNSGFSGTFGKAQQQLLSFQREIHCHRIPQYRIHQESVPIILHPSDHRRESFYQAGLG